MVELDRELQGKHPESPFIYPAHVTEILKGAAIEHNLKPSEILKLGRTPAFQDIPGHFCRHCIINLLDRSEMAEHFLTTFEPAEMAEQVANYLEDLDNDFPDIYDTPARKGKRRRIEYRSLALHLRRVHNYDWIAQPTNLPELSWKAKVQDAYKQIWGLPENTLLTHPETHAELVKRGKKPHEFDPKLKTSEEIRAIRQTSRKARIEALRTQLGLELREPIKLYTFDELVNELLARLNLDPAKVDHPLARISIKAAVKGYLEYDLGGLPDNSVYERYYSTKKRKYPIQFYTESLASHIFSQLAVDYKGAHSAINNPNLFVLKIKQEYTRQALQVHLGTELLMLDEVNEKVLKQLGVSSSTNPKYFLRTYGDDIPVDSIVTVADYRKDLALPDKHYVPLQLFKPQLVDVLVQLRRLEIGEGKILLESFCRLNYPEYPDLYRDILNIVRKRGVIDVAKVGFLKRKRLAADLNELQRLAGLIISRYKLESRQKEREFIGLSEYTQSLEERYEINTTPQIIANYIRRLNSRPHTELDSEVHQVWSGTFINSSGEEFRLKGHVLIHSQRFDEIFLYRPEKVAGYVTVGDMYKMLIQDLERRDFISSAKMLRKSAKRRRNITKHYMNRMRKDRDTEPEIYAKVGKKYYYDYQSFASWFEKTYL